MERFEVLPMREDSIPDILKLAEDGGLSPWSDADYRAEIYREGSITLEALEKKTRKTRAFIVARLITISNTPDQSEAEILNITVDSDYRKLGLGSTLLDRVITIIAQHSPATIWLEVRSSNSTATAFYGNKGFTVQYVRKNFYSNPTEDAFVMKLDIYG